MRKSSAAKRHIGGECSDSDLSAPSSLEFIPTKPSSNVVLVLPESKSSQHRTHRSGHSPKPNPDNPSIHSTATGDEKDTEHSTPSRKKVRKKNRKKTSESSSSSSPVLPDLSCLQDKIGYKFSDSARLVEALTHPSAKKRNSNACYQRLEFLGDKVLGLIVANYLFVKNKLESEGEISRRHSRIVCGSSCSRVAIALGLGEYVLLSQAQERDGGKQNPKILENVLEALIGAIYIDGNLREAKNFIFSTFKDVLNEESTGSAIKDPKTILQEWAQKKKYRLPTYTVTEREIGVGSHIFEAIVSVPGLKDAIGAGKTIKSAERSAAERIINENKITA